MKLFLTGDDGVAAVLGFEELERERERSSGVNEVRKGRGVFIDTVKNCSPEDLGRTCPCPFSFTRHVSPTYCVVEIVYDRG